MSIHIGIDDLPPDAIAEDNWNEDDLTAEDCGFDEDDIPVDAYEDTEETLIADSTDDSPTIQQDMSNAILSTVIPNGGQIYGFQLIAGTNRYNVYRFLNNNETEAAKQWELRDRTITITNNRSLEITFRRTMKPGWTTIGVKPTNDAKTNFVLGVLPEGVYNHEL